MKACWDLATLELSWKHTLTVCTVCAHYTLIICYRMRSLGLLFATVVYANKANRSLILSFELNQVKTYEKV